jgi:hypothetical protein
MAWYLYNNKQGSRFYFTNKKIYYYAKATLHMANGMESREVRVPFKVLEKFGMLKAHPVFAEKLHVNLPFGGTLSAKVWLDRNAYFPGTIWLDNNSKKSKNNNNKLMIIIMMILLGETILARVKINSTWVKHLRNIFMSVCSSYPLCMNVNEASFQLAQELVIQVDEQKTQSSSAIHTERQIPDLEPCYLGVR